jgi:transcription-repair coupling factor (superfamily II helicase)
MCWSGPSGVALYPPREGFGEVEPHTEIAGERVETLERLMRSDVHILLTTSRAVMERSHVPKALVAARLELRKGDVRRPEDLATHLERSGSPACRWWTTFRSFPCAAESLTCTDSA